MSALTNDLAASGVGEYLPTRLSMLGAELFGNYFLRAALRIGAMKTTQNREAIRSERGKVLRDEAVARGYGFESLALFGKNVDIFRVTIQGKTFFVQGVPKPVPQEWDYWLDDKTIVKERLIAHEVPVSRGARVRTWSEAVRLFETLDKPLIVKPRLGSRGRHTTTSVKTLSDLRTGFERAKQLCYWVIIEEHLVGSVYRATFVDGVLEGVLAGEPPRVRGDGTSTISELVMTKNNVRNSHVSEIILDPVHEEFLARNGLSLNSVPKLDKSVDLLEKIGVSYGGNSIEVTDITNEDIKRELKRASDVLSDPLIGLDFIIPDISASPYTQKWGIIECNGCPFINLHHDPVEGTPRNVAAKVWDYVERNLDKF